MAKATEVFAILSGPFDFEPIIFGDAETAQKFVDAYGGVTRAITVDALKQATEEGLKAYLVSYHPNGTAVSAQPVGAPAFVPEDERIRDNKDNDGASFRLDVVVDAVDLGSALGAASIVREEYLRGDGPVDPRHGLTVA